MAMVAQVFVMVAPLAEFTHQGGASAHVEAEGTSTHRAHDEVTCAICQMRLVQSMAAGEPDTFVITAVRAIAFVAVADRFVPQELVSSGNPRAPPRA